MKRNAHFAWAMVAALAHLFAPVVAYAQAGMPSLPNDLCSTATSAARRVATIPGAPARNAAPLPSTHEHHCAHAPCCAGGAIGAEAPPSAPIAWLHVALAGNATPAANGIAAPPPPIVAAQPRGPPTLV